jgi:hypothetical protein
LIIAAVAKHRLPAIFPYRYFAINLKTAKGLGLTVPPSLLARADELITPCCGA